MFFNSSFAEDNLKLGKRDQEALSARTVFNPIQIEDSIASVPQPGLNFSSLKRVIPRPKVTIEQVCDFPGRARPLDLVQRANDVFVEPASLACDLAHLR